MKVSVKCVVRCLLKESAGVSRYLSEQEVKFVTAQATPPDVHRNSSHASGRSPHSCSFSSIISVTVTFWLLFICLFTHFFIVVLFIYYFIVVFYSHKWFSLMISVPECSSVSFSEIFCLLTVRYQTREHGVSCRTDRRRAIRLRRVTSWGYVGRLTFETNIKRTIYTHLKHITE